MGKKKFSLIRAVYFLVGGHVLLAFIFWYPFPGQAVRFVQAWSGVGHAAVFGLVGMAIQLGVPVRYRRGLGIWALLSVPLLEAGQYWTGRQPTGYDVVVGWLGLAAGMLVAMHPKGVAFRGVRVRHLGWSAVLIVVVVALWPVWNVLRDRREINRTFPVLASFSSARELGRWHFYGVDTAYRPWPTDGEQSALRIQADGTRAYPGVFMRDFKRDWSGWQSLHLKLYVDSDTPLRCGVRVDDQPESAYADRFQAYHILAPGVQEWVVELADVQQTPGGRQLDLHQVWQWGFFLLEKDANATLWIGQVWLE